MRQALIGPALILALLAGCAARQPGRAPRATPPSGGASADTDCARQVRATAERLCADAPPSLPDGYALRARVRYGELARTCSGPRSRHALRRLDECVTELEADPGQIDPATAERRRETRARVDTVRADPLYPRAVRRLRAATAEADRAAEDFRSALQAGDPDELRFRLETWTSAEQEAHVAARELERLIADHGIDLRDARALGLR
jgi:hypothetical protein